MKKLLGLTGMMLMVAGCGVQPPPQMAEPPEAKEPPKVVVPDDVKKVKVPAKEVVQKRSNIPVDARAAKEIGQKGL
jgi:hypothetical protein